MSSLSNQSRLIPKDVTHLYFDTGVPMAQKIATDLKTRARIAEQKNKSGGEFGYRLEYKQKQAKVAYISITAKAKLLDILSQHGPLPASEIAQLTETGISSMSMVTILKKLIKSNQLKRFRKWKNHPYFYALTNQEV